MGKFAITLRSDGKFKFRLEAGNGQVIFNSEGYTAKANCYHGIESVRRNAQNDNRYERMTSANGKYYFNLKASNGRVIGTSELYQSADSRESGIISVRENASIAPVEDQTT